MAKKSVKPSKAKKKIPQALKDWDQDEVRFLELAIANHERAVESATGDLKGYFGAQLEKNKAKLAKLTK